MTPWQVLRANRVTRAGLGYRGHGPGVLVHYSTAPNVSVAAVAPDNSRTFCLSREKLDLQQLNRRLATYLQQVQYLEATNQRLEHQIQEELNRKCPRELKKLNGYLRTASLLHDQISECLSSQAQVKLQLLSAELTIFDFKARCEKEREHRGCVETDVSDLRLLEEVLKVHTLPELRTLLEDQTQQLMELRIQHQQDMRGLLAQASGGVTVEMQAAGSSDLLQQLDDLRQTSVTLLNQNECLFNTQVSMLSSPELTFNPPAGSEVVQAELEDLRRTAASLEEELTHLQAMNMELEASGLEQTESVIQQLEALQQRADDLCRDLDSVLQATAQQAVDYQTLLDVKNRLETEIEDYRRLLDGLSQQGLSSLHSNSAANVTPNAATSPSAHRRNISANKTVPVHGGNLRMMGVQTFSRGYIHTVRQTPVVNPLSNHSKNSPVTSINTSNLTGSFHKSEKQTTEETRRESMTIKKTVNRQSNPVEAKVHSKNCDLKNSSIVSTEVSQSLDKGAVLQASKSQINAAQVINTLVPDTKSAKSATQAKPETYTPKQVTAEACLQANKTDTHIQTEITKTILYAQPQVKQGPHIARHLTTTDLNKETAAAIKTETQTMITAQKDCTGGSSQAKNQDPAQTVSLSLVVSAEVVKNAEEAAITASSKTATKVQTATTDPTKETAAEVKKETKTMISAQMVCIEGSNQANNQDPAQVESLSSDPLVEAVMDAEEVTATAPVVSGSQGIRLEEAKDKVSGEGTVVKTSKPDSNTAQGITSMVPDTQPAMNAAVQEIIKGTSEQTTTKTGLQANKTGTNDQTEITKTILCAEPEVQQGPDCVTHTAATDPTKETAAEAKTVTESVISARVDCTEGSVQAKSQDPAQVVSLNLETPATVVRDAEEVAITAPVVSGSQSIRSEETKDKVSGEGAVIKASKPDSNTAQGITTMVPDTKPAMNASSFIQEITETTEAVLQANKTATNVQTEIAKAIPEVKQGRDFVTHTATTDPTKESAAEVKKVTETVISAQIDCTGGSNQAKNQDPTQVASLSLDPSAEPVGDAVEVEVKVSTVSGSHIFRSEEAQDKVSHEGTVVKTSKPEVNTTQGITSMVPDTQPAMNAAVQEIIKGTSAQTTTKAGLQANKTGTNDQTEITKTILCIEPEVQQGPDCITHTAATDPTKETAAEVKTVTESVISAHVDCTEGSVQAKSQDPAQVVSLSLEIPAAVVRDAEEVAITAPVVSGSQSIRSEETKDKVSGEGTVVKASIPEINTVQGITTVVPYTQPAGSAAVQEKTETFTSEQTTVEAGLQDNKTGTNIQTEITKTILCTEPEVNQEPHFVTHTATMDPAKESAAEVKKETEIVISAKMNCTEGSIQAKDQDPAQVVSLSLETPAGAVRDAEGVAVTASIVSGSDIHRSEEAQDKVSGELTLINDKAAGSEENKGVEEVECALLKASNSEHNKVMKDAGTGSGIPTASFVSPDSKENLESKTTSTEILKKVEVEINKEKAINGFHDTNEVKVDRPESDNDMVYIAGEEVLQSTTKLKKSVSLTDSGVALSSSDQEEVLSPSEADVYMSPTSKPFLCLSSETCLSPIETEVLMHMTDQVFCPVDLEEHVRSPDYLPSPNDPEMFLSQNDSDKCLSPTDAKGCLSPNGEEEDEEVCLSLTEANTHVRPVEKYILSTKEEGQSLSFSSDQALPGEDRNTEVSISVEDGKSLCFGSFDGNKGSRGTLNGTNTNSIPTSQGISPQLSSSHGSLKFGSPDGRSIIADKEEQLGFRGLYRKGVSQARTPHDMYKVIGGIADNKDVQNSSGSPGGRYGSETMKEISTTDSVVRGQKNNDWLNTNEPAKGERLFVRSSSFGGVPANGGTTFSGMATKLGGSGMANDVAACFGVMAANSSGTAGGNTVEAGDRLRRGSGDWLVYGGSLGRKSTNLPRTGSEDSPSGTTLPATSRPETGRFGRGSGEWVVYSGSFGRKSTLDSSPGLPSEEKVEGPSVATNLATSPQETGRFSCRGSEGWMVYGGSLGRKNSLPRTGSEESPSVFCATSPPDTGKFGSGGSGEWMVNSGSLKRNINMDGSDILRNTESRESQSTAMHLPTSPPGTGRFSSRSGEWRVYGGSTGYVSNVAGSNNLSNVDNKESPSVAMQLATSPPGALRPRRFGSGDSGEWRVYGGSTGRLSSASNAGKAGVSTNYGQVISPPSSYTSSGPRLSSTGSGGRLSSGGVVRRSSSVGSGGRLSSSSSGNKLSSSSSSNRISSSGRFTSTGSGERKPVYSSASGRRSTSGSTGRSGGGGTTSNNRAPSPGGRMSLGSGGWLNSSTAGANRISSPGSGSRLSSADSSDRISSQAGGRISSSSGSGRTNSTGGRVISSSDRPIRSTGSGAGGNKERISVCKMAALSISAAGRERSQDRQRQAQRSQEQQATAVSPLVQRWLTTGVGVTSAESDGLDDIMRL